jgi:hypothetical protein
MKKVMRIVLALLVVLMASTLPAFADRGGHGDRGGHFGHRDGHVGIGLFVGPGWWWPGWWDPYPYYPYYPSPPVIVQQPPDVYVQPAPQAVEPHYWYYCPEPQGYYPYVKKCPKGWMKVIPPSHAPE